ncbi:hypothetical protein ACFLTY_04135 [Chloroflexota bacterium]
MVNVTKRARQELKRILTVAVDMPQARLRLIDRGRGKLGLGIDVEMPGDKLIDHDGLTVLVIEPEFASSLTGVTIDVDNTSDGVELVVLDDSGSQIRQPVA